MDDSSRKIELQFEQTGNAPRNLASIADTMRIMQVRTKDVNYELMQQSRLIEQSANKQIENIRKQQRVHQEVLHQLKSQGMELGPGGTLQKIGGAPGPYQPVPGGGGGLGGAIGSGIMGGALRLGGTFAAVYGTTQMLASSMAAGTRASNDFYPSDAMRRRAVMETLPIVGGLARATNELARAEAVPDLWRLQAKYGAAAAAGQARGQANVAAQGLATDAVFAQARAAAVRNNPLPLMPGGIDQTTVGGSFAHQVAQMQLETRTRQVEASRGVEAARAARDDAATRFEQSRTQLESLRQIRNQAQEDVQYHAERIPTKEGGLLNGKVKEGTNEFAEADMARAALEVHRRDVEIVAEQERMEAARVKMQETAVHLAEQENAARQANVGFLRTELEITRAKLQAGSQTSTSLGLMNRGERIRGLSAVRFIRQRGIGSATPDIIQAGLQFDPEYVRKQGENFGASTPEFQAWRKEAGAEAGLGFQSGDLSKLRQQQDELLRKIGTDLQRSEEQFAGSIATTFESALLNFLSAVDGRINDVVNRIRNEMIAGKALGR